MNSLVNVIRQFHLHLGFSIFFNQYYHQFAIRLHVSKNDHDSCLLIIDHYGLNGEDLQCESVMSFENECEIVVNVNYHDLLINVFILLLLTTINTFNDHLIGAYFHLLVSHINEAFLQCASYSNVHAKEKSSLKSALIPTHCVESLFWVDLRIVEKVRTNSYRSFESKSHYLCASLLILQQHEVEMT